MSQKRVRVIYHGGCTDGQTAAWVAARYYEDDLVELLPYTHDMGPEAAADFARNADLLLILDFSFQKPVLKQLVELVVGEVVLLDHHLTAFLNLTGGPPETHDNEFYMLVEPGLTIVLDNKVSGALLTWCYLWQEPNENAPLLVQYVSDQDLWKFEYPDTRAIIKYVRSRTFSLDEWDEIAALVDYRGDLVITKGEAMLDYHDFLAAEAIKLAVDVVLFTPDGIQTGLGVAAPYALASDVAGDLAKASGTFGLCWFMLPNGKLQYSLRSRGEAGMDVSALASCYGGGGHKNAAGFHTPYDSLNYIADPIAPYFSVGAD